LRRFVPKREGSILGFGGTKQTKEQDEEDLKVLQRLVNNKEQAAFLGFGNDEYLTTNPAWYLAEKTLAGALTGVENLADALGVAITSTGQFITGAGGLAPNPVSDWFYKGADAFLNTEQMGEAWSKSVDTRYHASDNMKEAGQIFHAAGNLALPIATEAMTFGGSPFGDMAIASSIVTKGKGISSALQTAKKAASAIKASDIVFGSSAGFSAAQSAYSETGEMVPALKYGILSGTAEVLTEKLLSGLAGTDFGKKIIRFPVKNKTLRFALDLLGEGGEEVTVAIADPFLRYLSGVTDKIEMPSWNEIKQSGFQGVALSLLMKTATYPVNKNNRRQAVQALNKTAESVNAVLLDERMKLKPLAENASIEEIENRQNEIKILARKFAAQSVMEEGYVINASEETQESSKKSDSTDEARLLEARKRGEVNEEVLDRLTANDVEITADEVRKVTGFGEEGAKLVAKLANQEGKIFTQAVRAVKNAYGVGFTDLKASKVSFANAVQKAAFDAGKIDRGVQDREAVVRPMQALKRTLIQQGVPLTDRKNIIQAATEIESTLTGTKHNISSVVSGARKITNNLAKEISKKVGSVQNLWGMLHTNLKALKHDTIPNNNDLVFAYADTYLGAMKNNEPLQYNEVSKGVQNISGALPEYIATGIMPEGVQNKEAFISAANDVLDITRIAEVMLENAREQLYGNKTSFAEKNTLSEKSSYDIIETTGAKVSYALDSTGSDAQPGVMWTIEEDILTKQEIALFYREIAKINYGGSKNYQVSSDGEYIFDIENKLIYTDGNYSYPTITKVISFDSVYEDDISLAKELILNEEGVQSEIDNAIEIIETLYGPGFVTTTNVEDSGAYARQVGGGKRADSGETYGTGEANAVGEKEDISYSFDNATEESEVNENESERNEDLLHDDGSKRKYSKSSGRQTRKVDGRSRRYKEGREAAGERRKRCKALKDAGHTRKRVILDHRCEVIPEEHYDSEMTKLVKQNEKNGIDETILVVGGIELPKINGKVKIAKGMFIRTADGRKVVVVQYDHEHYSPRQINDHELVHNDYGSERTRRVKNIILKTLPIKKRYELLGIIQDDYSGILEDLEGDALEELVANILSGMHYLSDDFLELSKAYWNKDDAFIKRWEYEVSKKSFARAVEKGYASEMQRINRQLAYDEYAQLREYIMDVNNRLGKLKATDCKEIGNTFYIWRNKSKTDYEVIFSIPIEENNNFINLTRSGIQDGTIRGSKGVSKWAANIWGGKRGGTVLSSGFKGSTVHGSDDQLSVKKPEGYARGYSGKSSRDTSGNRIKYALDKNGMWEMEHIFENDDPDAEAAMMQEWEALLDKYGAIPSGENPHRDVQVPKKTAKNKKVSQTVRTILEAKATPDEALPAIEKMVEDGVFSYDAYTDKKAIKDSEDYLKEYGWTTSFKDWMEDVEKGIVSKRHTAMGWALYNNAVNRATTTASQTERREAMETALSVLDGMVRHQRSAAQALQATRILKSLSPETQLYRVQKSVQAFQKELIDKYGEKAPDLKINEKLAEQFLSAKTEDARLEAEKEIYKDIGRQMPSTFADKWNAWRYVAMLANVRTHVRNIKGNAFFAPVVLAKNLTATAIESVVNRVSHKKIVRSKALITGSKADKALLKAAWDDYANVADIISGEGKYGDNAVKNKAIEEGRTIFKSRPAEWVRKKNSDLLNKEDMWFAKPHYAYALAQYCKANNITAEQIARGKAIAPAREYAIKEAQKATYRDTNAFSQMISDLGRNHRTEKNIAKKAAGIAIEGTLPFRKTPANILVRGVEYSPIGLLKGLTYDLKQVQKGEMEAYEAIDNISAGLTGTGLLALGVLLAAQGLVRGHGEEEKEEKEFKELMGHQSYALELPNGQSITLDWLAPEALPFFVGVNLWEATKGSKEKVDLSTILQSVSHISEPMLEMSCLQGLNDLFEGIGYASSNDTSGLVAIVSSAAASYLTQGIPTFFGQAERTGEENRMTTYTEKNGFLTGDMQYTLGKASAKIPFVDYHQIPYIDAWGRKEASGTALKRGFNNFLNPAYTSTVEESKMEKELLRLYEKTGETSVFPKRADKYFTVDEKRKDLTAEEYVRYATLKGEKSYKAVTSLVNSSAYKKLTDAEKVKAIEDAYDYANQKAKKAISNSYQTEKWTATADAFGTNVGSYLSFRSEVNSTRKENGDKITKQQVADIVLDMAQNGSDAWKMYLSMYDGEKDLYAYNEGVAGDTYMEFIMSLDEVDEPTKSGKYGTYTQDEATAAIEMLDGLSRKEKAALWQSVNTSWKEKNNPFK